MLRNGMIPSPFFIFIKCAGLYSDAELLRKLGLEGYKLGQWRLTIGAAVYVTEDKEWMHIADTYSYAMWHMPTIRSAIADIAREHDVFSCSFGDCDDSYDFIYYRGGQLVRKYVVTDPTMKRAIVVEDFGPPLPSEPDSMDHRTAQHTVLSIASSLGIDLRHEYAKTRVYTKSLHTSDLM